LISLKKNPDRRAGLKIAMVGTKGIPAKWGGIEKYIEEISTRLVIRGHSVTVFASKWFTESHVNSTYKGIQVKRVPSLHFQASDALTNAAFASFSAATENFDVVNFHGYASYFFVPIIKMAGKIALVTTHGIESGWNNPKYGWSGRSVLRSAFSIGVKKADRVFTVAHHLKLDIEKRYHVTVEVLPSGLDMVEKAAPNIIKRKYGLRGMDYILFLGRIDPIKRIDWVLDLSDILEETPVKKVVIAGGPQDTSTSDYYKILQKNAENKTRIVFTGPVYGREKTELLANCRFFINPSKHEGLPITILEAISNGKCCLASDIPAHAEVMEHGSTGFLFHYDRRDSFRSLARELAVTPQDKLTSIGFQAKKKIEFVFNWDHTTDKFIETCQRLHNKKNAKAM
jgi:glycosyltransferase involved in cell wall biosynthesis